MASNMIAQVPIGGSPGSNQWPASDAYAIFLQTELERAQPYPVAASGAILEALTTAVFDVLSLSDSPQTAAERAASAVQP